MSSHPAAVVVSVVLLVGATACASRTIETNHVFFQTDVLTPGVEFEVPYPPLDLPAERGGVAYRGVSVLGGTVRYSRPESWQLRRASRATDRQFVEYVSPRGFLFAVYQRSDSPSASWSDVLAQYESDAATHVEWLGKAIPIAGYDTQGREYVLRRTVRGQRAPYVNTSREFLFRGRHSFASVEFVHSGLSDVQLEPEVLRTVQTFSVL